MTVHIPTQIELIPISNIKPNPHNARVHSPTQRALLAENYKQFGFLSVVVVDQNNVLQSGHLRLDAARDAGLTAVPAVRAKHLGTEQLRAFALADNQLATLSEWDFEILAEEFAGLLAADLDFDIAITGFDAPEIDAIMYGDDFAALYPADEIQKPPQSGPAITQMGELWAIGAHRLLVGDARSEDAVKEVLSNEPAQLVAGDPPYNVRIKGHVSGKGLTQHREFKVGSGELSDFRGFNREWLKTVSAHCRDGALIYTFMDGAHLCDLVMGARDAELSLLNVCVWAKNNAGMGSLYRSQVEHVCVFKAGRERHVNNVQLGRHGRNRSTLWQYPGMNAFGRGREAALAIHPTVKPVCLLRDIILDASRRGDVVLDPFVGSGSTIIAAHRVGRRGFGIEIDPLYVDAALDRLHAVIGIEPTRLSDGARWSVLRGPKRSAADER